MKPCSNPYCPALTTLPGLCADCLALDEDFTDELRETYPEGW